MADIKIHDLTSMGLLVDDVGPIKGTFDFFDRLSDMNGIKIYELEIECFVDATRAIEAWQKKQIGSFTCRGNSLFLAGEYLSVTKLKIQSPQDVPLPSSMALQAAIDSFNIMYADEVRLSNYCRCDFYFDVCEARKKDSQSACQCDPDCEPKIKSLADISEFQLKDPCMKDEHCDSWCPSFIDPDCVSALLGTLPSQQKRHVPKPEFQYEEIYEDSYSEDSNNENVYLPMPLTPQPQIQALPKQPVCKIEHIQYTENDCGWTRFRYNPVSGKPELEYYCTLVPRVYSQQICR